MMRAFRPPIFAAVVLLGACANLPPPPMAELPGPPPGVVTLDPGRQAILHSASVFASATPMAGQPWIAAQAISEVEYLSVELRFNQRWTEMPALVSVAFEQARPEWRAALSISPDAPAQAVIDAMTGVRQAFAAQDAGAAAAALDQPIFREGGAATLARLSALPPLPMTARAAVWAQNGLWSMQRRDGRRALFP